MHHTVRSIYMLKMISFRIGDNNLAMLNRLHWADLSYLVNNHTLPTRIIETQSLADTLLNKLCDDR